MTLGCETPCKLLSPMAVGMAINDTPTLVTTDTRPVPYPFGSKPAEKFQPCFWDTPGAPPALFASLVSFSREAESL